MTKPFTNVILTFVALFKYKHKKLKTRKHGNENFDKVDMVWLQGRIAIYRVQHVLTRPTVFECFRELNSCINSLDSMQVGQSVWLLDKLYAWPCKHDAANKLIIYVWRLQNRSRSITTMNSYFRFAVWNERTNERKIRSSCFVATFSSTFHVHRRIKLIASFYFVHLQTYCSVFQFTKEHQIMWQQFIQRYK